MTNWHTMEGAEVLRQLGTNAAKGLDGEEASRRLEISGLNELVERGLKSPWRILWEQLTSSMVVILIVAAVVSALLGDVKDTIAILIIVVLNAFLGFHQEYKAEKAMAALKAMAVPVVRVMREGRVREISSRNLVSGDIVLLETGNLVPADGRLLESANLRLQESALTGESQPVGKRPPILHGSEIPLADRRNMVYMGTVVTYGRGRAVITETGMATELGRIATMIQTVQEEATPLQRRLSRMGRTLALAAAFLVAVIFSLGLVGGGDVKQTFLIAISMAVAAIPEGLPAVVTIALALGSQRMLKRRALIRKLPAVEALGSVTMICSDKTGTLTENCMTVTVLDAAGEEIDLRALSSSRAHAAPVDTKATERAPEDIAAHVPLSFLDERPPSVALLLAAAALCNDAVLRRGTGAGSSKDFDVVGDPTETALLMVAARAGLLKSDLDRLLPRVAEIPFDSDRKLMTTVHRLSAAPLVDAGTAILKKLDMDLLRPEKADFEAASPDFETATHIAFTKGAVDHLLNLCTRVLNRDHLEIFTDEWADRILASNDRLAAKGIRVLGVACRAWSPSVEANGESPAAAAAGNENLEQDLTFIGLTGMIDPPRAEVREAVATCTSAGIRPVMITGDHPLTALYIAHDLGITNNDNILTGEELERMSVEELEEKVDDVSVYARVTAGHKLHIVQALQKKGHIVAMTGDGVNDAPALKKADIGVAMGITGTDVTKEVADMVLLDDNFATIVAAVEEGRVIYDNIRKFIKYLLTTNSGEIWLMLLAPFLGMPLPLLPLQILWINLVTDGLPALALGVEPAERDIMRRPPYRPGESIFAQGMAAHILWVGLVMGLIPLLTGYCYWSRGDTQWQTMVFTILTLSQMSHALAVRSMRYSLFTIGVFSNKPLLAAVGLTTVLQLLVMYVPFLQGFFRTVPLSPIDLILCLALSTVVFGVVEAEKLLIRRRTSQRKD